MGVRSQLYIFWAIAGRGLAFPGVKVSEGILEGASYVTEEGKTAYKFLGVPFASPPVGDLRFKAPQPHSPWNGIRQAKELRSVCKCYPYRNETTDEDCLYVNIYTSNLNSTMQLFPVMVFIPGGGFQKSIIDLPTDWLIMENIVLVTMVYRVGVFGFLSLDTEEVPGNAGLKDQVVALKWINRNIAAFGGDPDNIMVFGQSAGGASVNYHLVSDMSKGLFHKAAMMSGNALSPWAYMTMNPKQIGIKFSNFVGCPTDNESETLRCLREVSSDELLEAVGPPPSTAIADENLYLQDLIFLPSKEQEFKGQEAFLTESAHERMKNGKFHNMPIMAGYTDAEAILKVKDAALDPELLGMIDIDFERYVPRELCLEDGSDESLFIADQIRKFYYGEEPINENVDHFIVIKSDTLYKRGINEMIKLLADKSSQPVYYYRFSFYDPDLRNVTGLIFYEGASHVDDLYFFFTSIDAFPRYKPQVEKTRMRMVKLFSNFAKYGDPTPKITELLPVKWEPVTKNKLNYLSIDMDLSSSTNPDRENIEFWENLVKNAKNETTACRS